ncbi:hypothetical protein HDU77_008097 [Chytriomyces hyalinus]|nr:hypothetical protein HDU77_008097 [Chytriomyces hyalinus]
MQSNADKPRCAVFVFSDSDAAKRRKKTLRADSAIEFDCLAPSVGASNVCVSCEMPLISGDLSLTTSRNETKHWRCVSNEELALIQATSRLDRFDALPAVSKFIIYRAFVRGSTEETRHSVASPLQQHSESNIPANPVFVSLKKSRKQHELPPTTHFPHWLGGDAPTTCDTPSEATGLSDRPFDITESHSVYPFMMSISEPLCSRVVKRLEDAKKARVLAQMLPASFAGTATVKAMADRQCEDEKLCCSTSEISSLSDVSDSDAEMAEDWDADSELTDMSFTSSISSSAQQQPKAFSSKSRRFSQSNAAEMDSGFDTESVLTELSYQSSAASDTYQAAIATTASASASTLFPTPNANPPLWQFRINLSDRKPPLLVASSPPEQDDETISVLTEVSHILSESEREFDHTLHKNDTRYRKQPGFSNSRNTNARLATSALNDFNMGPGDCSAKSTMKRKREDSKTRCSDCGILFSRPDALKRHIVKKRCQEKRKHMSRESTESILGKET